jgi:surface-anchored protein
VAFEDDALELVFLDEANEREIFPTELVLMAADEAQQIVPEDSAYSFLGVAGDTVYVLPQEEQEGVLYVGIAGDEIESGLFEGEAVSLHLVGVRGPGNVSLYATDAFGAPQVFFNSGDGIDEQDVFPVAVGGHAHQNWAFTAPGVYKVDVQASGTLAGASEAIQSEVATFTFHIVGAPVTAVPLSLNRGSQGSLVLSWHATQGATYALETTQSLSAASWSLLGDRIQGEGARVERPLPADSLMKNQFFRLRRVR